MPAQYVSEFELGRDLLDHRGLAGARGTGDEKWPAQQKRGVDRLDQAGGRLELLVESLPGK